MLVYIFVHTNMFSWCAWLLSLFVIVCLLVLAVHMCLGMYVRYYRVVYVNSLARVRLPILLCCLVYVGSIVRIMVLGKVFILFFVCFCWVYIH